MINRLSQNNTTWIDLLNPTRDEVLKLMSEYGILPHIAEDLLTPTPRSNVQEFPEHIYLVLHFPAFGSNHDSTHTQEIDFILGKNYIITSRYELSDAIYKFCKIFEVDSELKSSSSHLNGSDIFIAILTELCTTLSDEMASIEEWIRLAEEEITDDIKNKSVITIAKISRNLLDFKQTIQPHDEILNLLINKKHPSLDNDFPEKITRIYGEYKRIITLLESNKEDVDSMRTTNDSLINTRQNDIIASLTLIAALLLPLSLISSIFGMNVKNSPIIGSVNDFWIIISIMLLSVISFFFYFKYKKWF